jgi:Flp pilus assembly protein TadD
MTLGGGRRRKELRADVEKAQKLLMAGKTKEMFEFLVPAVDKHPNDPELRLLYATMLMEFRPDEVGTEALKALAIGPDDPIFLTRIAGPLIFAGLVDEARSSVVRARELAPTRFAFEPNLKNYEGVIAALDGKDEIAEARYRSAVAEEPENTPFAVDLARFLANRGRKEEAIAVIDEALPRVRDKDRLREQRDELTPSPPDSLADC